MAGTPNFYVNVAPVFHAENTKLRYNISRSRKTFKKRAKNSKGPASLGWDATLAQGMPIKHAHPWSVAWGLLPVQMKCIWNHSHAHKVTRAEVAWSRICVNACCVLNVGTHKASPDLNCCSFVLFLVNFLLKCPPLSHVFVCFLSFLFFFGGGSI